MDGKVKQDFFTRIKELQGGIDKLYMFTLNDKKKEENEEHKKVVELMRKRQSENFADLRVDLTDCKNKVTSLETVHLLNKGLI